MTERNLVESINAALAFEMAPMAVSFFSEKTSAPMAASFARPTDFRRVSAASA
jgi:hypothetical protein